MHNTTSYQNMYPGPQNAFDIYYSDSSISALYELKSPYLLIKEVFDYDSDLFKTYAEAPHYFYQNEHVLSETIKNFSRRHQHNFFEIMFVMRGSTEQKIEDQKYLYHEGQCCLLDYSVRHRELPFQNTTLYFLMLSDDFVSKLMANDLSINKEGVLSQRQNKIYDFFRRSLNNREKQYLDFYPKVPVDRITPALEDLFDRLSEENQHFSFGSYAAAQGMISKILGIMLDYSLYTSRKISVDNSKNEYLFIQIQRLLESHRGKISRQEISDILHYSDSYLNKIVNRSVGMSLLEYRKFFMIKEAARLLSCTDKTISEIIDDLGFSGHTYFNSFFKKQYGVTPAQYRKNSQLRSK